LKEAYVGINRFLPDMTIHCN